MIVGMSRGWLQPFAAVVLVDMQSFLFSFFSYNLKSHWVSLGIGEFNSALHEMLAASCSDRLAARLWGLAVDFDPAGSTWGPCRKCRLSSSQYTNGL